MATQKRLNQTGVEIPAGISGGQFTGDTGLAGAPAPSVQLAAQRAFIDSLRAACEARREAALAEMEAANFRSDLVTLAELTLKAKAKHPTARYIDLMFSGDVMSADLHYRPNAIFDEQDQYLGGFDDWTTDRLKSTEQVYDQAQRENSGPFAGLVHDVGYGPPMVDMDAVMDKVADLEPQWRAEQHVAAICDTAGLPVMQGILQMVTERELFNQQEVLTLSADDVETMFAQVVGPAADTVENLLFGSALSAF